MSEREQFEEAWIAANSDSKEKADKVRDALRDIWRDNGSGGGAYFDSFVMMAWTWWKASREALKAEHEPVAYVTYKGYLLHAGDPKVAEYSDPIPLYMEPLPSPPAINHPIDTTPNQYDALGKVRR